MTAVEAAVAGCGWAGQAAFAWRTLHQWIASERARRPVVPRGFWAWSLVGTALSLAYALGRQNPVFILVALTTGGIFARNAVLASKPLPEDAARRPPFWPLLVGLGIFAVLAVAPWLTKDEVSPLSAQVPLAWAVVGYVGLVAWSGRFVVQWWASEHLGHSVLPASFFLLGLAGTVLLLAYAIRCDDLVQVAAYAPNVVPYGRNLWILRRAERSPAAAPPADDRRDAG